MHEMGSRNTDNLVRVPHVAHEGAAWIGEMKSSVASVNKVFTHA
jgi:hypothetical protein